MKKEFKDELKDLTNLTFTELSTTFVEILFKFEDGTIDKLGIVTENIECVIYYTLKDQIRIIVINTFGNSLLDCCLKETKWAEKLYDYIMNKKAKATI